MKAVVMCQRLVCIALPAALLGSVALLTPAARLQAAEPALADPANVPPPPAHAIGFPSRDPHLDALPGFQNPPPGYGEVAFYWWLGDPLTRERLAWQIDELAKAKGVMGLQINYAHSDRGGRSYGLTFPGDPPLFSPAWWELVGWFIAEAKRHGMAVSLSDYTLGIGQGWTVDDLLRRHPELTGLTLGMRSDGRVVAEPVPSSLNPMHPLSGKLYAESFFGQFERHCPGEAGRGLNFFFSDELGFGVGGNLWSAGFAREFQRRKGYDITPELPALFKDIGPRTPKVRLDYRDVMVSLSEEGFFKPCFDWHQQRGMIFGCDHGGRGRNVVEFGDYFRTQRWNQGPGCDQPRLGRDLIKNKVACSIAHLYLRPRVWLEGYYGSGWGTTTEQLTDATFANFAQGQNLLTLHGLYYSTHGGFWEWAPPCNHFRMPYWAHMEHYLAMVQRLSYLLSQGHHRCDVAVIYPVAPMEAGLGGKESVDAAFATGRHLYAQGIDFDFLDFQSLVRAKVDQKELRTCGERYRVLVLPAMRAVRWSTLEKAVAFQRAGGLVIVLGALPEASDRAGRDDAELDALVALLNTRVDKPDQVAALVERLGPRDFAVLSPRNVAPNFAHRRVGPRDVFMVHNAPQNAECWFRAVGKVELWDPWTGAVRPLAVLAQTGAGTRLRLPLSEKEAQLIVFSPGRPQQAEASRSSAPASTIPLDGTWHFDLQPTLDNRFGDFRWPPMPVLIGAEARQFRYADEPSPAPGWESPAFDDSAWPRVTCSFGPKFWKLGPLPPDANLDAQLAALAAVDPTVPVKFGARPYRWQPYDFSWRWGIEGDPGHQGYHGLKENVTDHFLCLGARRSGRNELVYAPESGGTRYYLWSAVVAPSDGRAHSLAGGLRPAAAWLNHQPVAGDSLTLKRGANPLLLRYDAPGRGYFVVRSGAPAAVAEPDNAERPASQPAPLAMRWFNDSTVLPFDTRPQIAEPAGWYRFRAASGLRALAVPAAGNAQAWADGAALAGERLATGWRFKLPRPAATAPIVALRIAQPRGAYAGAAIPDPVAQECAGGTIETGDWSKVDGLACYSGGAWYRKTVALTPAQAGANVVLDLGALVSSAEVRVNGQPAGVRVAPPWRVDISKHVKPGKNRLEILVFNTLANHYLTVPTRYRGELTSGLLGPVKLETR